MFRDIKTIHYKEGEIDIALYMCGKLLKDWFQTSLILSPVLTLIVGEEPVLYTMPVLVDWAP